MKLIVTLLAITVALSSFGQERKKSVGLNRYIPDDVSSGLKIQANSYSPSLVFLSNTSVSSSIIGKNQIGGGGGVYFRKDLKEHFSIQPEINFHFMSGSVHGSQVFTPDTNMTISKETVTSYKTVIFEVPVNFKWRWELIATRKGHYKANSAIGIFIGPRFNLTPYSLQVIGKRTVSTLYDQRSESIENPTLSELRRYSRVFGMGLGAGVDFELYNGFIVFASYYRGLLSSSVKTSRFKSYENRLEVGIGIRFK